VARLLAAIPVESAAGLRLRALVLAYLLIGRRRSEVLSLRWRDLDLEGGFYRYTGKGGMGGSGRCPRRSGWLRRLAEQLEPAGMQVLDDSARWRRPSTSRRRLPSWSSPSGCLR